MPANALNVSEKINKVGIYNLLIQLIQLVF